MAINFSNVTAITLGVDDVLQIQDSLGTVLWQKTVPLENYFYIEDISGQTNTLSIVKGGSSAPTIEPYVSTDQQTWVSMGTTSTTPITYTIPANTKLYIKCNTNRWGYSYQTGNTISASGRHNVGGNIMSLLYNDDFENKVTYSQTGTFNRLFYGNTNLVNASDLLLPATTLTTDCYTWTFHSCSSMVTAPAVLPATTLTGGCYQGMFEGTAITETPVIYGTNSMAYTFSYTFNNCPNLNKVYVYLTGNQKNTSNINNWLQNVAATGDFYNLGGATFTIDSPSGIPVGWTEHHSLPVPCNVSISAGSNGSISVNGVSGDYSATVMSDTQLALVATPDSGYEFDSWSDGDTNASRTITVTGDLTLTASFAQAVIPNYFYIEDVSGRNGRLSIKKNDVNAPTIEVFSSTDGTNWTSMGTTDKTSTSGITGAITTVAITATIPANGKLYLKVTTDQWGTIDPNTGDLYNYMNFPRNCNVGGNIMSLLYGDDFDVYPQLDISYNCQFMCLFINNRYIIDASNLILPSNTDYGYLPDYCFYGMFSGCSSLTAAPELPALELGEGSYKEMFNGCTSLDTIVCYCEFNDMPDCTDNWLNNVAVWGNFYNYGDATYTRDASGIPRGWLEHTS